MRGQSDGDARQRAFPLDRGAFNDRITHRLTLNEPSTREPGIT